MQQEKRTPEHIEQGTSEVDTLAGVGMAAKKQFVEPEISTPVDVLEATTFFQGADSGVVP